MEKNIDENDINAFRYCGEYYDKETATVYLRARFYNPSTDRFTQRDSFAGRTSDPLSLNLYTYCANNPVYYSDPSGHFGIGALLVTLAVTCVALTGCSEQISQELPDKNTGKAETSSQAKTTVTCTAPQKSTTTYTSIKVESKKRNDNLLYKHNWTGEYVTNSFKEKVAIISNDLKIDKDDLMAVMAFESRFDPKAVAQSTGATGLIQFMPSTAESLGTSTDE